MPPQPTDGCETSWWRGRDGGEVGPAGRWWCSEELPRGSPWLNSTRFQYKAEAMRTKKMCDDMTDDFLAEDFPSGARESGSFWESHRDVPEKRFLLLVDARRASRSVSLSRWPLSLLSVHVGLPRSTCTTGLDLVRRSGLHVTRFCSGYCAPIRNSYIYEIYANCGIISRRHFLPPHGRHWRMVQQILFGVGVACFVFSIFLPFR